MATEVLKDAHGHKIGEIQDTGGKRVVLDSRGHKRGEYDPSTGTTRDARGQKVGEGNLLATLLSEQATPTQSLPREKPSKSGDRSDAGLLLLLVALVLSISPGAAATAIAQAWLHLGLDVGQMWTFAVLSSIAVYVLLLIAFRSTSKAGVAYLVICFLTLAVFAVAHFGFKASFPTVLISYFIRHG